MADAIIAPIRSAGKPTVIYGLIDPRDGTLRYVGKTISSPQARLNGHIAEGLAPRYRRHVVCWIMALLAAGVRPKMVEIETVPSGENWEEAEQFWIAYLRSLDADLC